MRKFTFLLLTVFLATSIAWAQTQTRNKGIPDEVQEIEKPQKNAKDQARTDMYTCDFEDIDDFSLEFTPWTVVDADMQETYGFNSVDFTHEYEPMAYICFNPSTTTPPMTDDPEIQPHSGEKFGACFASVPSGGQGNDDWFISSQFTAGSGANINFWAKSYTDDYGLERFNVAVSTTGSNPEDFEVISGSTYIEVPMEWTEYNYDLSDYAGEDIYVAIQCVSNDAFIFMIDDIVIEPGDEPSNCDNFDELMPGDYVAENLPMWDTWSGTPGSDEDAVVSDSYSYSPDNSAFIHGSTDLLRLFGDATLTEGSYKFTMMTYVLEGYSGYYNLQKDIVPGVEWGVEIYFYPDGSGGIVVAGGEDYPFDFEFDTWVMNEVMVDLDNDWAEVYIDGEMIAGWEWHLGADGSGELYTLGSADIWAWEDEAESMMYIDDVCFEEYYEPTSTCNDFEDYEDFTLDLTPWNTLDVDGLETYGFNSIDFMHEYEPMSFIIFNPSSTTPPMTDDPEIQPYDGERFAACFASVPSGGQGNDDWLMSPMTELGTGSYLEFYAKSYTDEYGLERFNVGVSTTGTNPEDFTIISADPYEEAPMAWTYYSYDLSDYDYQDVYVGIQCVSLDAFIFMVDNVCIYTEPTDVSEVNTESFRIYPNPAVDMFNVFSNTSISEVQILNSLGQLVYQSAVNGVEAQISTESLETGLYFVIVKTENGSFTQKLLVK